MSSSISIQFIHPDHTDRIDSTTDKITFRQTITTTTQEIQIFNIGEIVSYLEGYIGTETPNQVIININGEEVYNSNGLQLYSYRYINESANAGDTVLNNYISFFVQMTK